MDIKRLVDDFVSTDIGGMIVTDENDDIVFSEEDLTDHLKNRFLARLPHLTRPGDKKLWELTDANAERYYRILTAVKEQDGALYRCHCLTDVSELADLSKNISEYSRRISDFSDFQGKILKVISRSYDSFLPALAELCGTEEAVIRVERTWSRKYAITTFDGEMKRSVHPLEDMPADFFDMKRFESGNGYVCFICEPIAERRCSILLKESSAPGNDYLRDIAVYNTIRLYVENGILREKIIYESEHDPLTGMYNGAKFSKERAADFGRPGTLAIYITGVGDLEYMNDHYGNEAGDMLIKRAADSIRPELSENIMGFRIGGDKFAVAAKNISREESDKLITVWKERLAALNEKDKRLSCVISCGKAFGEGDYETERLLEQADVGMYREKRRLKEELIKKASVM